MSTTNWDNSRWGHLMNAMNSFADMSSGWLHPVSESVDDLAIIVRSSMEIVLKKSSTNFLSDYFSTSASSLLNAFRNLMPHLEKYLHAASHQNKPQLPLSQPENEPQEMPPTADLIASREIPFGGADGPPAERTETKDEDLSLIATSSQDPIFSDIPRTASTNSIPSVVNSRPPPPDVAPTPEPTTDIKEEEERTGPVKAAVAAVTAAVATDPAPEEPKKQPVPEEPKTQPGPAEPKTQAEDSSNKNTPIPSDLAAIETAAAPTLEVYAVETVITNSDDDDDVTEMTEPLEEDGTPTAVPTSMSSSLVSSGATESGEVPVSPSDSFVSEEQTETTEEQEPKVVKPAGPRVITPIKRFSYSPKVLDWAYASFAAPHKAVRRELTAMVASVDEIRARRKAGKPVQAWQVAYFCEWVVDWFGPAIREHHDNEQELLFPFLATKLPEQPHDLADAHDEIIVRLNSVCAICKEVLKTEGEFHSLEQLEDLQEEIHCFHNFYCGVMYEEEKTMPAQVRKHFTEQEVLPILEQMYARGGTDGLARGLLPSMMLGEEQCWAVKTSRRLSRSLSKPLRKSFSKKVMPDHLNCVVTKRDAPFLDSVPDLERSQHSLGSL